MNQKIYGKIEYLAAEKKWKIKTEPHIVLRLKRMFERIKKDESTIVTMSDSIETCADLEWFISRYPMEMDAPTRGRLRFNAKLHVDHLEKMELLVRDDYVPPAFPQMQVTPRKYQKVAAEWYLREGSILLGDDVGLGKAQPIDCNVLTPDGWRKIGDLKVGDVIFDPSGGTCAVKGVFPQGIKPVFELSTPDGGKTRCCDDHLWHVFTQRDRKIKSNGRVLALKEFRNALSLDHAGQRGWKKNKYFLPVATAYEPVNQLKPILPPWMIGALIGNGGIRHFVGFSSNDQETIDKLAAIVLEFDCKLEKVPDLKYDYRITKTDGGRLNRVKNLLEELDLFGKLSIEKALPAPWSYWSSGDRLALLQGLMDTDGDCVISGTSIFNTSSRQLALDVIELVRSLGGIASISVKENPKYVHKGEIRFGHTAYRINVRLPVNPFTLKRKAERWKKPYMARAIEAVVPAGEAECVCISVDSKHSTYITDDHIVTHNTISFITSFTETKVLPVVVVTHTFLQTQWKAEIEKCLPNLNVHIIAQRENYAIRKINGRLPDVILISYSKIASWCRWISEYCNSVVYDECQELRHSGTQKYDAAMIITNGMKFRGGASATPIFGYGGEMFNVLNVLKPGCLGEKDEFIREWCVGEDSKLKIKHPAAFGTYLRENFIMLRRTREEVGREIPLVQKIPYAIDSDEKEFKKIEKDAILLARTMLNRSCNMMQRRNAGGQLNSMVRKATGVAKAHFVSHFVSMLLESVQQVVLFGWHHECYAKWVQHFETAKIPYAKFTGEETPSHKEAAKTRFINGDARVMIMSLRSGAGVDGFQHICNTCVFGELDYSPAVHVQATGRIARDGQDEPVNAYYLVSNHGSDPIMSEVLGVKKAQLDGINSPDHDVVENMQLDGDHIKRLAMQYLSKANHSIT